MLKKEFAHWRLRVLGDVHRKAGRETEATAAYENALAIDPEHGPALERLEGMLKQD